MLKPKYQHFRSSILLQSIFSSQGAIFISDDIFTSIFVVDISPTSLTGGIFGSELQNMLAGAEEDLTKDKIGAKVGEMTSFARQDCLFCTRGCDNHG